MREHADSSDRLRVPAGIKFLAGALLILAAGMVAWWQATARPQIDSAGSTFLKDNRKENTTEGSPRADVPANSPQPAAFVDVVIDGSAMLKPQNPPTSPPQAPDFASEFSRLADAGDWSALARFIQDSIRTTNSLKELLPILLALLETVKDRATYDPVGRSVQAGLIGRRDLKECVEELKQEFLTSESALTLTALAGPLVQANAGVPDATLKQRIEKLLIARDSMLAGTSSFVVRSSFEGMMIAAHTGHAGSILESIEFIESLRAAGNLATDLYVEFWEDDVTTSFAWKKYFDGDIDSIVSFLLSFTRERLGNAVDGRKARVGLKNIWSRLREDAAYDALLAEANGATDDAYRNALDEIAGAWLAYEK